MASREVLIVGALTDDVVAQIEAAEYGVEALRAVHPSAYRDPGHNAPTKPNCPIEDDLKHGGL